MTSSFKYSENLAWLENQSKRISLQPCPFSYKLSELLSLYSSMLTKLIQVYRANFHAIL